MVKTCDNLSELGLGYMVGWTGRSSNFGWLLQW